MCSFIWHSLFSREQSIKFSSTPASHIFSHCHCVCLCACVCVCVWLWHCPRVVASILCRKQYFDICVLTSYYLMSQRSETHFLLKPLWKNAFHCLTLKKTCLSYNSSQKYSHFLNAFTFCHVLSTEVSMGFFLTDQ